MFLVLWRRSLWWDEGYVFFWGAKFYSNAKFHRGLWQAMTKKNHFWKNKNKKLVQNEWFRFVNNDGFFSACFKSIVISHNGWNWMWAKYICHPTSCPSFKRWHCLSTLSLSLFLLWLIFIFCYIQTISHLRFCSFLCCNLFTLHWSTHFFFYKLLSHIECH